MKQISLSTYISENKPLSENDIDQIMVIVSHRCRIKTCQRLRFTLNHIHECKNYGIYSRLVKENGKWTYICGQSWNDEMRTLRECILCG